MDVWDPPFSKLTLHCVARNTLTAVLSGQSRLHGQDICQASGENGRRALRPPSLPSPAGVLPDLPRELLCRRNAGGFRALAGSLSLRQQLSCFQHHEWRIRKNCNFFVPSLRLAPMGKLTFHPLTAPPIWTVARYCRSHWESDPCSANTELRFGLIHREVVFVHKRR